MARIKVPFLGITTNSNHKDGECRAIVNMRPENGAWHPVAPRKVLQKLSDTYDIVFVHRNSGYENWIGVISGASYSTVYKDIKTEPVFITSLSEKINGVQQIGNTLSFVTETNIYYALYKNSRYVFLGELPELPPVQFKTSDKMGVAEFHYKTEYGETPAPDDKTRAEQTKGLIYKAVDKYIETHGIHLFDAHFIRYAFRLYDGTLIRHSSPVLLMPVKNILDIKTYAYHIHEKIVDMETIDVIDPESSVKVFGYKAHLSYDFSHLENWSDIITSVDFFLSDSIGLSNPETIKELKLTGGNHKRVLTLISPDSIKRLRNTSAFYFIKSVKSGEAAPPLIYDEFPSKDLEISKLENLKFQEQMTDDSFSHHKYGAKSTYAYNNRLRLSGVSTTFSRGFNPQMFMWFNTSEVDPDTQEAVTNYNGYKYADSIGLEFEALMIEVQINIGVETEKAYHTFSFGMGAALYKMFLSAFLSYPDPRATRITIYRRVSTSLWKVFTAPLEKHNSLNIAYYLHDGLKPIWENANPPTVSLPPDAHTPITVFEANKLKVSEVNNPFVFPNVNTYQVGSGRILNESSIVMNVTDRNYGLYPVFVFTDSGVFTMSGQTADTVHQSVQAPTYMEPPTSDVICATPYGVAFITKRGLMMINQHATEFISPQLRETDEQLKIDFTGVDVPIVLYPNEPFEEYLQGVDMMFYNPYKDELIIVDSDKPYNLVYDFSSKVYYLSTELVDQVVQNVYPEVIVIGRNELKDYKYSNGKATGVAIVTRPITFGVQDRKKLERVFLRGILRNVNNGSEADKLIVAAYQSDDEVHFDPARGMRLTQNGNYKDFDMGLFARTKFRSYLFAFAGVVDEDSEFRFVEFETDKEYTNEKMR